MMSLAVHAAIVRVYAAATRAALAPLLQREDAGAQFAKLLLGLADSTADCAEEIAEAQQDIERLAREMGLSPPRPKLRTIEGGKR